MIVGQRVAVHVQRGGYGQSGQVRGPRGDRYGRDGDRVGGRVIVRDQRHVVRAAGPVFVRGEAARLDVRVHEATERAGAGVREHVVARRLVVVVLVAPAHRHHALETVGRVL